MAMALYRRLSNGETDLLSDLEKVAPDGTGLVDDLQLAALLGKTLLEKNTDLEVKLKRLEDFAEETLVSNQSLARQLTGCKDALKFSNRSCENLELKLEEYDTENRDLKLALTKKDVTIQVKNKVIDDLQKRVDTLEVEITKLRNELKSTNDIDGISSVMKPEQPGNKDRNKDSMATSFSMLELQEVVDDLNFKLQNATYQKSKVQQTLDTVMLENSKLTEVLEKTETEVFELQSRVKILEEGVLSEKSEAATPLSSIPPQSPTRYASPGTPMHSFSFHSNHVVVDDTMISANSRLFQNSSGSGGLTLFAELQAEYNSLQNKFDDFVANCQCKASSPYKEFQVKEGSSSAAKYSSDEAKTHESTISSGIAPDSSLKSLFQEVYATLKQTTLVADKLIERRKSLQT